MNPPFVGDLEVCVKAFKDGEGSVIDVVVIRRQPDRAWHVEQASFSYPTLPVLEAARVNWQDVCTKVADALNVDAIPQAT